MLIFLNDQKGISYFDYTPPVFFKVKTANFSGSLTSEKTMGGYFQ